MKAWFSHEIGYINMNEIDIYVTKTGNWSECDKLFEKNEIDTSVKSGIRTIMLAIFTVIAIVGFLTIGKYAFFILVFVPVMFLEFKKEAGDFIKIPFSKIDKISIDKNSVQIDFKDFANNESTLTLYHVEHKGLAIFNQINSNTK